MKRGYFVEIAHNALSNPDKSIVDGLLNSVNLSLLEREVITRSELDQTDMETICNTLQHWNNKYTICSRENLTRIKGVGMVKIGKYLENK